MYFTFLDNGLVLQIKTNCSRYSPSKDEKTFTFCQNEKCCSTGALPAQDKKCKQNNYGFGTKYKLGECSKFPFDFDSVKGNVTYHDLASATDGWTPEWVKLVLGNVTSQKSRLNISGAVIKCSFDGRIDGNDKNEPTFINFDCKPEGKFLHYGLGIFLPFIYFPYFIWDFYISSLFGLFFHFFKNFFLIFVLSNTVFP